MSECCRDFRRPVEKQGEETLSLSHPIFSCSLALVNPSFFLSPLVYKIHQYHQNSRKSRGLCKQQVRIQAIYAAVTAAWSI